MRRTPVQHRYLLVGVVVTSTLLAVTGCTAEAPGGQPVATETRSVTPQVTQLPTASNTAVPAGTSSNAMSGETNLDGSWTLAALVGENGGSVLARPARDIVSLTFRRGDMTGTTVCNSVWGHYGQSGANGQDLRFANEKLGSTLVACADEPPLTSRLIAVRHVSGSPGVRYLHSESWMIIAELRRAP